VRYRRSMFDVDRGERAGFNLPGVHICLLPCLALYPGLPRQRSLYAIPIIFLHPRDRML